MNQDNSKIQVSVGLSPIVSASSKNVKVGDEVSLNLITGLLYNELFWDNGSKLVPTPSSLVIVFDEPGVYIPIAQGHRLHQYYAITVNE